MPLMHLAVLESLASQPEQSCPLSLQLCLQHANTCGGGLHSQAQQQQQQQQLLLLLLVLIYQPELLHLHDFSSSRLSFWNPSGSQSQTSQFLGLLQAL